MDEDEHILGARDEGCPDDQAACSRGTALLLVGKFVAPCQVVEVWCLARHVATITRDRIEMI
jgi:hypothetical protein